MNTPIPEYVSTANLSRRIHPRVCFFFANLDSQERHADNAEKKKKKSESRPRYNR